MTSEALARCAPVASPLATALDELAIAPVELLQGRELLRRIDHKYVVAHDRLPALIAALNRDYAALRVASGALATYRSLYFDSPDLRCFHDHRRGRRIRHKIRIRHYPDRELSFLETKSRRNELVTDKLRLQIGYGQNRIGARELEFVRRRVGDLADELTPVLWVNYRRISLVGLATHERVTIDVGLEVAGHDEPQGQPLPAVAVVEVKRAPSSGRTPVMAVLADAGCREQSMSKYTVALATLRPTERSNRLRPDFEAIRRLAR